MDKKEYILPSFLIVFAIALLIFLAAKIGLLSSPRSFFEKLLTPLQGGIFRTLSLPLGDKEANLKKIDSLLVKIIDEQTLVKDNTALRDQFEEALARSLKLLRANIAGENSDYIIIDRGRKDGVREKDAVVKGASLVGRVVKTSEYASRVEILSSPNFSIAGKVLGSDVLGVIRGNLSEIVFDKVLLSSKITKGDIVVTKGDLDVNGRGLPPNLVIGQIESVDKKPSDLFQKAKVKSFIDIGSLSEVFVAVGIK